MKKIGKRFWALFLIFTMLLGYVPEGMTFFAGNDLEISDQIAAPESLVTGIGEDGEPVVYTESVVTLLSSATQDATIYYTLDESTPTLDSNRYQNYIMMTGSVGQSVTKTLKAIAVATVDGKLMRSEVATYTFTIALPTTVTLIWEGLLSPMEGITADGSIFEQTEDGKTIEKFFKKWTVACGNSFETVTYAPTDDEKYYFPDGYGSVSSNGILVKRDSSNQISVSGTPIADVRIELVTPSLIVDPNKPGETLPEGEKLYFGSYPENIEYGDEAIILAAGGFGAGRVTYESSDEKIATVDSKGKVTIKGIGKFTITATKAASDGFAEQKIKTKDINAIPREVTITEILADEKYYDGTKVVKVSGARLDDLVEGDTVVLTGDSDEAEAQSANAGSQPLATLPEYSISGKDAYKYNLVQPKPSDVTVTIKKLRLNVVGFEANDKIYDGTTATTSKTMGTIDLSSFSGAMLEEVKKLRVVEVEGASAVSFADANVARDAQGNVISQAVVVTIGNLALEGEGAGNFEIATATAANAKINPKDVQISVADLEGYNGHVFDVTTVLTVKADGILEADKELVTLPAAKLIEQLVAGAGTVKHENAVVYEYEKNKGNYNFVTDPSITVKGSPLYVQPGDLTYVSDGNVVEGYTSETWYKDLDLKPSGANGYTEISFDGITWKPIVSLDSQVADGSAEAKTLTIYLRKATGETTEPYKEVKCSIDKSKPTAKITVKKDVFKEFLNELTFGLFFTETITVTFEGEDTGSGVKTLLYYKYDYKGTPDNRSYTVIDGNKHTIQCKPGDVNKFYLKVRDNLGHESDEVSSTGVVVHNPLEITSKDHEYRNGSEKYAEPKLTYKANNNIVTGVFICIGNKDDGSYKEIAIDYTIDANTNTIVLKDQADLDAILFAETAKANSNSVVLTGIVKYYQSGYANNPAAVLDAKFNITFKKLTERTVDYTYNPIGIVDGRMYDGTATDLKDVLKFAANYHEGQKLRINENDTEMKDAGSYALYAYIPETDEFCCYEKLLGTYTISKRPITITSGIKGQDRTYAPYSEGNPGETGNNVKVIADNVQYDGLVAGDSLSVKIWNSEYGKNPVGEMENPDAGNNKPVGGRFNVSLEGADAHNYDLQGHNAVTVNIYRVKIDVNLRYNYTDNLKPDAVLDVIDDTNSPTAPGIIFVWKRGIALAEFTKTNTELAVLTKCDQSIKDMIAAADIKYTIESANTTTGDGFYNYQWDANDKYKEAYDGSRDLYVKVSIDDSAFVNNPKNKNYELVDSVYAGKIRISGKDVNVLGDFLALDENVGAHRLDTWVTENLYYYDLNSNGAYILAPNNAKGYDKVSIDGGYNFYDYIIYTTSNLTTIDQIKETAGYKKYVAAGAIAANSNNYLIQTIPALASNKTVSELIEGVESNSLYGDFCVRSKDTGWVSEDINPYLYLETVPVGTPEVTPQGDATTVIDDTYYFSQTGPIGFNVKATVGDSGIYHAMVWDGTNPESKIEVVIPYQAGLTSSTSESLGITNTLGNSEKYATIAISLSEEVLAEKGLLGKELELVITNRANATATCDLGRIMIADEDPTITGTFNGTGLSEYVNDPEGNDVNYIKKADDLDNNLVFTVVAGSYTNNIFKIVKYRLNNEVVSTHANVVGTHSLTIPFNQLSSCENTITVYAEDYCGNTMTNTYKVYVKEKPTMNFDDVLTAFTYDIGYRLQYVKDTTGSVDLTDKLFVINGTSNGTVTFTTSDPTIAKIVNNELIIYKAGTFKIIADTTETNEYLAGHFESDSITVSKRKITVKGLSANSRQYNGTDVVTLYTGRVTYEGIVDHYDTVVEAITVPEVGKIASVNANANVPVTVTGFALTGGYEDKYEIVAPDYVTVTISKRVLHFELVDSEYGDDNTVKVKKGTYLDPDKFELRYKDGEMIDNPDEIGYVAPTVNVNHHETIKDLESLTTGRNDFIYLTGDAPSNYEFEISVKIYLIVDPVNVGEGDYEIVGEKNENGWYNTNVVIKPNGIYDRISGQDSLLLEEEGEHSKEFYLRDEVGPENVGIGTGTMTENTVVNINIDKTAPELTLGTVSSISQTSVLVKVSATDSLSGIAKVTLKYAGLETPITMVKDSEGYYTYELPVGIYENITVTAVDKADNSTSKTYETSVIVDNTSPTVDVTMTGSTVESETESDKYYKDAPTVKVKVEDSVSKIDYIYYTLNQSGNIDVNVAEEGESTKSFEITGLVRGTNVINIVAVDKAGNRTETPVTVLVTEYQGALSITITGVSVSNDDQMSYGDKYKVNVSQTNPSPENSPLSYHINPDDQDVAIVDAEGNITIVGVGTFTLYVTKGAIPGYFEAVESYTYTTAPKEITIEGVDAVDRDYDGTNKVTINSQNAVLVGLVSGDSVEFIAPTEGTVTDKNAAEDTEKLVSMTDIELTGTKAGCYELTKPTVKVVISKKDITVSVDKVTIKKGQKLANAVLNVLVTGLVEGESLSPMPVATYNDTVNTLNTAIRSFNVVYENKNAVDTAATNYNITYDTEVELVIETVNIRDVNVDYRFKDNKIPTNWNNGELVILPAGDYKWISTNEIDWYENGISLAEGDRNVTFYLKMEDGTQTESKTIPYKLDTKAPSVQFKYHENGVFRKGFELEGIAGRLYNLFFRQDNVNVTLQASDNLTPAGQVKVEYKVLDKDEVFTEEGTWQEYNSLIGINCGEKKVIYVRITDLASNKCILASNGIVVYKDSTSDTERVEYTKKQDAGELIEIEFNGNEIDSVIVYKDEEVIKELKLYNDYFITDEGIVLNTYYLDTLEKGLYDVIVSYDPLGEDYVEDSDSVAPNVTSAQLYVGLATLKTSDFSYTAPSNLEYDGNAKEASVTCGKTGVGAINVTYKDKAGNIVDEPINAGEYTVVVSVEEGKDYQAVNSFVIGKFTITQKEITLTGLTGVDRTYNGSKEVTLSGGTLVGVCDGDVVTPVIPAKGMVANADVANAKAVTVETITLTGADAANYTLVEPTNITVDITTATLNVSVNPVVIDKGQSILGLTATVTGFVNGETVSSVGVVIPTVTIKGSVDTLNTAITEFEVEYTNGNPTANYEFSYDNSVDLTINKVYIQTGDYTVVANNGIDKWNMGTVIIRPTNGYTQISTDGRTWKNKIELAEEGVKSVTFYLKKADGTQTEAKTLEYKLDNTDPTVEIKFNDGLFQDGLSGIAGQLYNLFFKNNVNVTINADDTLSEINKVEYQVVENPETIDESALPNNWKTYSDVFGITANKKAVVYVRLTDKAGNEVVYNSRGVVVYQDSTASVTDVEYIKTNVSDLLLGITFNGNTIKNVTLDGVTLPTDKYVITANGIEIDNAYLDTLTAGTHNVVVSYNPYGVDYKEGEQNQAPATTTFKVNVKLATLAKEDFAFVAPENLVYDAEAKLATVTCGKDGIGAITVKYYDANNQVVVNPTDVGTYTVKVSTVVSDLYAAFAETAVGTFTITEKEITLTGLTGVDRTYNGSKEVALSGGTLVGVCDGDVVTPVIPATGMVANADVANAKAVTVETIRLTGADAANYTLVQPTNITVDITTATLNVSVNPVVIDKGQSILGLTATVTGFVNGETVSSVGVVIPTVTIKGSVDTLNTAITEFEVEYANGNPTANYEFSYDNSVDLTINKVYIQTGDYTVVANNGIEEWNMGTVIIRPTNGYTQISTDGRTWKNEIELAEEGVKSVTFYLKKADGTQTEAKTLEYKLDNTNPTVEFSFNGGLFQDGLSGIFGQIYNLFFKENVNVTIKADDTLSEIYSIEYQVIEDSASIEETELPDNWKAYNNAFGINANQKAVVYVRLTDNAGNVSIYHSKGVVVYEDSEAVDAGVEYTKTATDDLLLGITFNENTIKDVTFDGVTLPTDKYVITANGIEIDNAYLDTLTAGIHNVVVSYNPYGVDYKEGEQNQAPATTTFRVNVKLATLTKEDFAFVAPENLVYNAEAKVANVTCGKDGIGAITVKYYDANNQVVANPTDAGTYTVKVSTTDGFTYAAFVETAVGTFTITEKEITLTGLTGVDRTYNGSKEVALLGGSLVGVCNGDVVTPVIPATGTMANADVANAKAVTVGTITLAGADAANYTLVQPTDVTVDITTATLSVSVNPVVIKKGQAVPALTVTVTGFVNGETTELTGFVAPTATPANTVDTTNKELTSFVVVYEGGNATNNYVFDLSNTTAQITIETVEANIIVSPTDITGWVNENVVITPGTGFDLISTNGRDWASSVTLTESGASEVTVYTKNSTDGTLSEAKTVAYKIDKVNPVIGDITYPSDVITTDNKIINNGEFDINVVVSDALSDVANVTYTLHYADGTNVTKNAIIALDNNSTYALAAVDTVSKYAIIEVPEDFVGTISMVVKDNVGNTTEAILANGKTFIADVTAPEVNIVLDGVEVEDGASLKCTDTIDVTVTDLHAGVKEFAYFVNGVEVDAIELALGENTIKVVATDFAGNVTTKTVKVTVKHDWSNEPEFTWNDVVPTATVTCGNDEDHVIVLEVEVTEETTDATCEVAGETVYTATVEFNGTTYTDTKTVEIEAIGHAYGEPVFTWDGTTATATVICGNDETHVIALEVEVTEVTTAATCTETGEIVYTATTTYEDVEYSDVKVVEIPALGHDWVVDMDEENHWKECTHEDCTEVKELEAHTLDYVSNDNASMLQNATETASCHCGYTHTREIPNTMIKEEMKEEVVEEETVGNGSVSTQVNKDEELPKTEIENLTTDVAKDLLTEKELQKVEDGATILVYLDVRNADETAPKKDKEETEKHVGKHVQNGKVGMYLDLSLFKKIGDDAASKITNTEGNFIEITIDVPKNLTNHNPHVTRTFYVVRVHDGVAEIISEGTTASTITFKTDRFSTYAIVYSDVSTTEKAPVTGDATNWYWYMMLMVVGLGVLTAGMKKQRR